MSAILSVVSHASNVKRSVSCCIHGSASYISNPRMPSEKSSALKHFVSGICSIPAPVKPARREFRSFADMFSPSVNSRFRRTLHVKGSSVLPIDLSDKPNINNMKI